VDIHNMSETEFFPELAGPEREGDALYNFCGPHDGLAPFILLRLATLPFATLERLRLPRSEAAVRLLLCAEADLELVRATVEDVLHRSIPRVDIENRKLRRRILSLRRNVHNGRPMRPEDASLDELRPHLEAEEETSAIEFWMTAQASLKMARRDLKAAFADEVQNVLRPALRAPLRDGNFIRSLELSNPAVLERLQAEKQLPVTPWPSNLERTLLSYLARAAAKTSPFASFMGLAIIPANLACRHALPRAPVGGHAHDISLNRGIVARLDDAARLEAFRSTGLQARVNPTLRVVARGRHLGLCNRETVLIGRPWYDQRWAQFNLDPLLAACLAEGATDDWAGWRNRLLRAGAPEAKIDVTLEKLLERGLLLIDPLTDAFDAAPIERLLARWTTNSSGRLAGLAQRLVQIRDSLALVERRGAKPVVSAIETIKSAERQVLAELGRGAADDLQNPVLETCWQTGMRGTAGSNLLQPMADLQNFLGRQVIVSPLYKRLRAAFVQQFGAGGSCDDPVMFLLNAATRLIDVPEFGASTAAPDTERAPPGVTLPVTAFVQITSPEHGRRPLMAVNRVFDGAAWLAARFTAGRGAEAGTLARHLRQWLHTISGDREPVDIVLAGHCSDLQAHAPLTDRVLCWPGEQLLLPPERIIHAASLRLLHNPQSDLIEVQDSQGRALNLCYLGATFPSPIWGVRYALSILTQPYLLGRPSPGPKPDWSFGGIRHEPRLVHGDVVLQRASWWASARTITETWFTGGPADWMLNAQRDFEKHGIPCQVFAQRYFPAERVNLLPMDVLDAARKPIWIDVRNPFCLGLVERMAAGGEWISLTEAFPAAADLWLDIEGNRHVSELHLEMIVTAIDGAADADGAHDAQPRDTASREPAFS
jgi:hypothetical protein